jgi:hypothetical protein
MLPHRITRPWHFSPSLDYLTDLHVELHVQNCGPGGAPKTPADLPTAVGFAAFKRYHV